MTAPSLREAAQMALEALLVLSQDDRCEAFAWDDSRGSEAIANIRATLALPDAEPVAWAISYTSVTGSCAKTVHRHNAIGDYRAIDPAATSTPLYAAPQPVHVPETNFGNIAAPVERKPLTLHEIGLFVGTHTYGPTQLKWFRFGEAAHGIKGAA